MALARHPSATGGMFPNGASNFSQRGSAGMSRIDLLHLDFDSQVLVHRNDGHGNRRSSVVSHNGKWSTFYAGNRLWDTETLSREPCVVSTGAPTIRSSTREP
jgi:hypothetical protein